ncbi:YigZ family protein [Aliiglaciecola sp. SL4]|uniref:YigZ family protein n=1 Tax=Aliiglaciecola sp. SL4 TaxID=3239806 RepID=UPI00355C2D6A
MSYPIPAQNTELSYEVKKSKFIACASFADSREQAMAQLASIKQQYPDARHHCWAYLLGNPKAPVSAAMSDDGEPSGTAGKPILNVLQHKDVGDIMLIVTRYFGGIKLGAGGLVRAYSNSAQQVIEVLPVKQQVRLEPLNLHTDFKHEQFIRHLTNEHLGVIDKCEYAERVHIQVSLPESRKAAFIATCNNVGIQVVQL